MTRDLTTHSASLSPWISIRPSRGWVAVNLRELWAYRELFFFLAWRDVKVRYKQTALGVAWALLQPLASMIIFTLIFGRFAGIPSDGIPYELFALAGLSLWTFVSNAITTSGNSLIGNTNLLTKVYFPRMLLPASACGAALVDLAISLGLLAAVMLWHGFTPGWGLLLLPLLVVHAFALALAVGLWMSALNVRFRDIRYALPFFIQLWMFASPIAYPVSLVPEHYRWVALINPMAGLIEAFRACLFDRPFDWPTLASSLLLTAALLVFAAFDFRRMERSFADRI